MTAAAAVTAMPLVIDSQGGRKNATTPGRPTGSGREVGDFHVSVALQLRAAGDGRTQRGQDQRGGHPAGYQPNPRRGQRPRGDRRGGDGTDQRGRQVCQSRIVQATLDEQEQQHRDHSAGDQPRPGPGQIGQSARRITGHLLRGQSIPTVVPLPGVEATDALAPTSAIRPRIEKR